MPRKKQNADEGTMLTHNTVESVSAFEATEAVAVAEPSYGDTATAALEDIAKDRKMWAALVKEVADGKTTPPEFLLKRLAPAVGLSELMAQSKFEEDVLAIGTLRKAEAAKLKYETKKVQFEKQHATEAELQQQLKDMLEETKQLRSLINSVQHIDGVIGKQNAITRRITAAFNRIF